MKLAMTLLTTSLLLSTGLQAATINEREAAQRQSIRAGLEDGSLTGKEAKRLRNQQVKLEAREQHYKSDGDFTRKERAKMHGALTNSRARIYTQRHDGQTRN